MASSTLVRSLEQHAKRIMMVRPTHFEVSYSINPWMDLSNGVNHEKAMKQWETLKTTIENAGAKVDVMESETALNLPDIVFSANAAIIKGHKAYLASFTHPERQGERYFYEQWFTKNGYQCVGDQDIQSEGAGDALWGGDQMRTLFMGVGTRTDARALGDVANRLDDGTNWKVIGCRLVDPRFYHIDTAFCPLNEHVAIYYKHAFDNISQHNIRNETDLIEVSLDEASNFACNAVVVGQNVIMNQGNDKIANQLAKLGFTVRPVDMSEFIKSGGSAKCCTLQI